MITLYSKNNRPSPGDVDGKIVLRDASLLWEAVSRPRRVVSRAGSKLTVGRLPIGFNPTARDGKKGYSTKSEFIDDDFGHEIWMLTVVRATCDTLAETIHLLHLSEDAGDEFKAFIDNARYQLRNCEGLELEDDGMHPTP